MNNQLFQMSQTSNLHNTLRGMDPGVGGWFEDLKEKISSGFENLWDVNVDNANKILTAKADQKVSQIESKPVTTMAQSNQYPTVSQGSFNVTPQMMMMGLGLLLLLRK